MTTLDDKLSNVNIVIGGRLSGVTSRVLKLMDEVGPDIMWTVVSDYDVEWEDNASVLNICEYNELNSYLNDLIRYQKRTKRKDVRGVILSDVVNLQYDNHVLRNIIMNAKHHNIVVIISSQDMDNISIAFQSQSYIETI